MNSSLRVLLITIVLGGVVDSHALAQAPSGGSNGSRSAVARETAPRMPLRIVRRGEQEVAPANAPAASSKGNSRYGQPIKLPSPQPEKTTSSRTPETGRSSDDGGGGVVWMVLSSLAIVLGLFFLVVWLARRALPRSAVSLPKDVLEVLGRSPLAARHNLQLIRLGHRLLLVSVTPDTAETLAEVTDVDEVNHLASLCRQHQPDSITGSFRQALHQLGTQKPVGDERLGGTRDPLEFGAETGKTSRPSFSHVRKT